MLEAKLEEFRRQVEINKRRGLLLSIDLALQAKEFFPDSIEQDNYFFVGDPLIEVDPSCLFGINSSIQLRVGVYQINNNNALIFEKGPEEITRSFKTREGALLAYDLVGAYFLERYLEGSFRLKFSRSLRQIIKMEYQEMPAVLALYSNLKPQTAILYTPQRTFMVEVKYEGEKAVNIVPIKKSKASHQQVVPKQFKAA